MGDYLQSYKFPLCKSHSKHYVAAGGLISPMVPLCMVVWIPGWLRLWRAPCTTSENAIASFTADLWRSRLQAPSPLTIVSLGLCAAGDALHSWDYTECRKCWEIHHQCFGQDSSSQNSPGETGSYNPAGRCTSWISVSALSEKCPSAEERDWRMMNEWGDEAITGNNWCSIYNSITNSYCGFRFLKVIENQFSE